MGTHFLIKQKKYNCLFFSLRKKYYYTVKSKMSNSIKCDFQQMKNNIYNDNIIDMKKILTIDDILKIKLENNQKNPKKLISWTNPKNQNKNYKAQNGNNIGIVCNEKSNCFGVDLDFYTKTKDKPYDPVNNPNHKLFIDKFGKDYIKKFDTFTQRTTNGGIHLIFQHDKDMIQTSSPKYKIDTRGGNTNGYLVGYNSIVNGKKYEVVLNKPIRKIPQDLKDFLINIVFQDEETEKTQPSKKDKKKSRISIEDKEIISEYSFDITEKQIREVLDSLPKEYYTDYQKWLCFTSGMKQLKRKDLWEEYSKKHSSYDKTKNEKYWKTAQNKNENCCFWEHLVKNSKVDLKNMINLHKYKKLPKTQYKPDKKIKMPYLTGKLTKKGYKNGLQYDKKYMVIKSDTGTAKSSSFRNYIENTNQKFISIVSRRILAMEQYEDFSKTIDRVDYYENVDGLPDSCCRGYICCIDSIMKINGWAYEWNNQIELKNRVVFLDEFNSLIEYIWNTPTMENKRTDIVNFFITKIFKKAKQIICSDADISDISMKFIQKMKELHNIDITFIENTHIHNKNTPAIEYRSKFKLISQAKKTDKYIFCCDSKQEATDIYKKLHTEEKPVHLIVARDDISTQDETFCKLTEHDRIVFSPKVVYGNDSVYPNGRDVFAYYLEHTISPS